MTDTQVGSVIFRILRVNHGNHYGVTHGDLE